MTAVATRVRRLVATDAHEGPVYVPAEDAVYFTTGRPNVAIRRLTLGCASGERLVSGWHAIAFNTKAPPASDLVHGVTATQAIRGRRVVVSVQAAARALVQVGVLCAGGR